MKESGGHLTSPLHIHFSISRVWAFPVSVGRCSRFRTLHSRL